MEAPCSPNCFHDFHGLRMSQRVERSICTAALGERTSWSGPHPTWDAFQRTPAKVGGEAP
jgi:hypothetical protein